MVGKIEVLRMGWAAWRNVKNLAVFRHSPSFQFGIGASVMRTGQPSPEGSTWDLSTNQRGSFGNGVQRLLIRVLSLAPARRWARLHGSGGGANWVQVQL